MEILPEPQFLGFGETVDVLEPLGVIAERLLPGVVVKFASEEGLDAVLLAGADLPGDRPLGSVVGDAEESLVDFLGTLGIFFANSEPIKE